MTEQMKIEELLNSYIDGELSVRQRTEVNRMISNDPKIALRLRELRQCKTLVSSLPITQAPSNIMENVKARLEEKNLIQDKEPVRISEYREVKTSRRIFAAAAMFSLTALLVVVINMLMPTPIGNNPNPIAADISLSGKLELKAADLPSVQSVISKAIKNIGLSDSANPMIDSNRRIYTLNCSRKGLDRILNGLEINWDKISSAKLTLDTKNFGESVQIASVTPSQISEIVNQNNSDQSIQVAHDISFANSVNDILNENGIPASGRDLISGELRISPPVLVSERDLPIQQDNGEKTIQLRIILSK